MKEYDIDAARRKFDETILLYKDEVDNLCSGYCFEISQNVVNNKIVLTYYVNKKNNNQTHTQDPLYHEIKNGFYYNENDPNNFILVTRRPNKTYKIGAHPSSYNFFTFCKSARRTILQKTEYWATTELEKYAEITEEHKEKALLDSGPISEKMWLSKGEVYYLMKKIGERRGGTFVTNTLFIPKIKQHLQNFDVKIIT